MSSRKILLAGASLLAIATAFGNAKAQSCATSGTITTSCPGPINLTGDLAVTNTGKIDGVASSLPARGVRNGVTIASLQNHGLITAEFSSTGAYTGYGYAYAVSNGGLISMLTNDGTITGSVSGAGNSASGVHNVQTIGTLVNSGTISALAAGMGVYAQGIDSLSSIDVLTNSGLIAASIDPAGTGIARGISLGGTIGQLTNSGTISAVSTLAALGIDAASGVTITSLSNSGIISATGANQDVKGISNAGIIGTFTNRDGSITAELVGTNFYHAIGFSNAGTIASFTNAATIAATVNSSNYLEANGIFSSGQIGTLTNSGLISALDSSPVENGVAIGANLRSGSVGTFNNSGTIQAYSPNAGATGISNYGTISVLTNSGVISAQNDSGGWASGIWDGGSIGTLTNMGEIVADADVCAEGIISNSITSINNSGTIKAHAAVDWAYGIEYGGRSLQSLINSGTISATSDRTSMAAEYNGPAAAIMNSGSITSVTNSGLISAVGYNSYGIANGLYESSAQIDTLANTGTISATYKSSGAGVLNAGTITALNNGGQIIATAGVNGATGAGILNQGTISSLTNRGTIKGDGYAIQSTGVLGAISNSGVIDGNIASATTLNFSGGSGTVVGTLTGGTITAPSVNFISGNLLLNDNIATSGGTGTVANSGAALSLSSVITITGNYTQTGGSLNLLSGTGELIATGSGSLTGGTITADLSGNYLAGTGMTLVSAAGGLTDSGVVFDWGQTGLQATTSVNSGTDLVVTFKNSYVGGTVGTITVTDSVSGPTGVLVGSGGIIGTLQNTGTISGDDIAILNGGTIGSIDNSGTIVTDGGQYGLDNGGSIGTFTNSGTITGSQYDIYNTGNIDQFVNGGHIGSPYGIYIAAGGTMSNLVNSGVISGTQYAVYNAGTLGALTNSGTINGDIYSANAFAVIGGSGSTFGTFTGGTITVPGLTFSSGNVALADAIDVGSGTVTNGGATLAIASVIPVTGNFSQTAGTLLLGDSGGLAVSGTATLTGGSVLASLSGTGNYLAGDSRTLVSAVSGSSYSGLTVTTTAPTGLDVAADTSATNNLVLSYRNDYVGGNLVSLSNSGTVGTSYGLYVASTGNLAAFDNTGTLQGSSYAIYNLGTLGPVANSGTINGSISSATALSISGGTGTTFGTLTGGTITAPSVSFTSGNVLLRDNISAANVTNSGAILRVDAARTISGNYSQTAGTLAVDVASSTSSGALVVGGAANITNSVITLSGSGLNYGQTYTVVDASAASSYTNDTVNAGSYFALLSTVGNDLVVRLGLPLQDIGNKAGGDAAVTGGVLEGLQGDASFLPVVTALANVSTAEQGIALKQAAPAQVSGGAALLQRALMMTRQVDEAIGQRASIAPSSGGVSLWGQGMGGVAQRGAEGDGEAYNISSWGLAVGADTKLTSDLTIGGAVSWSSGWNSGKGDLSGDGNRVNSYQFTLYSSWGRGAFNLNSLAAIGLDDFNQHRTLDFYGKTAHADYAGHHYEVALDGGYTLPVGNLSLTPTASFKWLRVQAGPYSESGADILDLSVGRALQDQIESGLGAKLSWAFNTSFGTFVPELKAMWAHDFNDDVVTTDAMLSNVAFTTSAYRPGSDGLLLGAGLTLYHAGDASLRVSYDGDFRGGYTAHTGAVQLKLGF